MRNPPKEYFSAGNFKLMDDESVQGMVITTSWMLIQAHKITKNHPNCKNFRIINSKGSLPRLKTFSEIGIFKLQ
jgi:hypothetical protein